MRTDDVLAWQRKHNIDGKLSDIIAALHDAPGLPRDAETMRDALRRSGDIDFTICTVCRRCCFVAFNDGLPCCHECGTKAVTT